MATVYKTKERHFKHSRIPMYMEDIKLYASSQNQLQQLSEIVKMFSSDIKMEFGLEKYNTRHFNKGKPELV